LDGIRDDIVEFAPAHYPHAKYLFCRKNLSLRQLNRSRPTALIVG
jgi:hypothetical protein